MLTPVKTIASGSPPRAWGQLETSDVLYPAARFTPTGVGTMPAVSVSERRRAVHPHGRGDNLPVTLMVVGFVGSPPRAWGQSDSHVRSASLLRFTPTGVGTIASGRWCNSILMVHPHGRGDNAAEPSHQARSRRFTPTGVGTIRHLKENRIQTTVHPHGRGDNSQCRSSAKYVDGSPPRAWGQFGAALAPETGGRFTPTGVGTIAMRQSNVLKAAVHPHGRGDNRAKSFGW